MAPLHSLRIKNTRHWRTGVKQTLRDTEAPLHTPRPLGTPQSACAVNLTNVPADIWWRVVGPFGIGSVGVVRLLCRLFTKSATAREWESGAVKNSISARRSLARRKEVVKISCQLNNDKSQPRFLLLKYEKNVEILQQLSSNIQTCRSSVTDKWFVSCRLRFRIQYTSLLLTLKGVYLHRGGRCAITVCFTSSFQQERTQEGGWGGGVAAGLQPHETPNTKIWKIQDFVDMSISKIYVIYPSAEISHWNRLVTSTLEFWKINK